MASRCWWDVSYSPTVLCVETIRIHRAKGVRPANSHDATLPLPYPPFPLLTEVRGYNRRKKNLELKMLVSEFQSMLDIKINAFMVDSVLDVIRNLKVSSLRQMCVII